MSKDVNFVSQIETAILDAGLAIRLTTVSPIDGPTGPIPRPGPTLEFLISAEQATSFAHGILEAVEDWKRMHPALGRKQ